MLAIYTLYFIGSIQQFLLYVELLRNLYFYIQEKYIKKEKDNISVAIIHTFIEYSLELLNGLDSLLLGSNNNSAISVYRTFYETYIVFSFIQNHPELMPAFVDHVHMDEYLLNLELLKLKNQPIPDSTKQLHEKLIENYGKDFEDSYGWTASVIKEKNKRNLKTMFEDSKPGEAFSFYYKLSCKYSHATSFSLQTRPNLKEMKGFMYAVIEIMYSEFDYLFRNLKISNTKEQELMKQWIVVCSENLKKTIKDFGY